MLKAILFDLGNTLFDFNAIDTRTLFEQAAHRAYAHLTARGHTLLPFRKFFSLQYTAVRWAYIWSRIRGREFNSLHLMRKVCDRMHLNLDDEALRELAWAWYSPLPDYTTVSPDVVPTLNKFRDRGLKMAIVSNTFISGGILDRHMDMHGLLEFFPVRIYSSETTYPKPNPRIFRMALDAVGVDARHAIFVGDTVRTDIVGARRVGMTTVLRQPKARSRTHHVADHVVREISELYQMLPVLGAPPVEELPDMDELVCEA
jgi:HAD superfamily hydrolase (TIGR01509 family)